MDATAFITHSAWNIEGNAHKKTAVEPIGRDVFVIRFYEGPANLRAFCDHWQLLELRDQIDRLLNSPVPAEMRHG